MKRPWAIYFLTVVYTAMLVWLVVLLIGTSTYFTGDLLIPQFRSIVMIVSGPMRAPFWALTVAVTLASYGLFRGKAWGRNLSMFLSLMAVMATAYQLSEILAITMRSRVNDAYWILVTIRVTFLAVYAIMFYLTLRPEVGRFCGVYPKTTADTT